MSRPIVALFALLALFGAVSAYDVFREKNVQIELTEKDRAPPSQVKAVLANDRANAFIGDLAVGQRYPDETVFRRVVEFNNPSNIVQRTTLNFSVSNGIIHYIRVQNDPGSYAVVCDEPNTLGTSRSSVNLRVLPNSKSSLTLTIAAH